MSIRVIFLTVLTFSLPASALAQQGQTWIAGLGMGAAFGVNEDLTRPLVLLVRAEAVAFNSIVPGISPEFGISIFSLRSSTTGGAYDYHTQIIAPDLRFRFSPLTSPFWFPYLFGGAGIAVYDVTQVPAVAAPSARLSDAAPFFTIGLGLSHELTPKIGLDINAGPAVSLSDDLNPVHDNKDDGWWSGVASLYWIF